VLVSALIADGPPSWLLEEAITGRVELVLPDVVFAELERVLQQKLGFSEERCNEALRLLSDLANERPSTPERVDELTGHAADDVLLACAVAAGVDILATGDRKHLLPLVAHRGIRVMQPQAVLAELRR
jgi:predicted nucleic acid-binding protein